jgi:putative membrane protein
MVRSCLIGIALIATLGVACNRDNADRQSSAPGEGGGRTGAANPPSTAANTTEARWTAEEQQFVQRVAQSNQFEVELAKMAQDKAQSFEVKEYARQLEQDHSEALDDVKRVANRASITLEEPPAAEKASLQDKLASATGRAFDRAYIQEMIEAHTKNIAEFERQQKTATGELKEFIDKTLPVMREHLQEAEPLQTTIAETKP